MAVSDSRAGRASPLVWVAGVVALGVAAVALVNAVSWYGHPVAGGLVTSELEVSSVGMPDWDGVRKGLAFPDRIVAVDGIDLAALPRATAADRWDQEVVRAFRAGAGSVSVRVRTSARERDMTLAIEPLRPAMWWLYGGTMLLTASLYVVAALTALVASPRGALARAFAKFALLAGLFLFTFFDAQTSKALVAVQHFAFGWEPLALVGLGLRLPDDAPLARRFPAIFGVLDVLGLSAGLLMAGGTLVGESTAGFRSAWTIVFGSS